MFSILLQLLEPALAHVPFGAAAAGLLELTSGLDRLPALPLPTSCCLTLTSFLLGFGGLAVQFQVRAVAASAGLPADGFAAAKLLHGALAALLTAALLRLSPAALAASAPGAAMPPLLRPMPAALLAFAALFAIWGGKQTKNKV